MKPAARKSRAPKLRPAPGTFPPDAGSDIFAAATFAKIASACCLGYLGISRELPPWLSLEADARRRKTAVVLHDSQIHATTYAETAALGTLARRISRCTESIHVLAPVTAGDLFGMILRCKSRWCPPCALSLSYKRAFAIVDSLSALACQGLLTHAVYTTPNVPLCDLDRTIKGMVRAWRRMHGATGGRSRPDPAAAPILGAVRNLEVTYNPQSQTYHPHLHALLHVARLDQAAYSWAWDCARVKEGLPNVPTLIWLSRVGGPAAVPDDLAGVHPVNTIDQATIDQAGIPAAIAAGTTRDRAPKPTAPGGRHGDAPSASFLDAAFEVSKYSVKPQDATGNDGFPSHDLPAIVLALRGCHVSQATGTIREHITPQPRAPDAPTYKRLGSLRAVLVSAPLETARTIAKAVLEDQANRSVVSRHYDVAQLTRLLEIPPPCQETPSTPTSHPPAYSRPSAASPTQKAKLRFAELPGMPSRFTSEKFDPET